LVRVNQTALNNPFVVTLFRGQKQVEMHTNNGNKTERANDPCSYIFTITDAALPNATSPWLSISSPGTRQCYNFRTVVLSIATAFGVAQKAMKISYQ
jgi:hypothetical protein